MLQIIQNKSHRRRNGARPVHNIIYRVYISAVEGSVVFATRTKTHSTTKHTHTQYRRMQSVPPRRWRHAISYVLARGSMDRADRAQGIRLIAQTFSLSLYLSHRAFLPFFLLFLPSDSLPERGIFTAETIFNSDEGRSVSRSRRSHECIRAADYNGRNSQLLLESSWHSL